MTILNTIGKYNVYKLDKETAVKHVKDIASLADYIPLVDYTEKEILAESKPGRIFYGKWDHSLIVFDGQKPIAILIAFEREAEKNELYPENSIYLSELAVDCNYIRQGIGRSLLKQFFEYNNKFLHLDGDLVFTIQTNSADWNKHVVGLYLSFGFKQVGMKKYDNRTDVVLRMIPN